MLNRNSLDKTLVEFGIRDIQKDKHADCIARRAVPGND
jgi:hypothetical protein